MSPNIDQSELIAGFIEESTGALRSLPARLAECQRLPERGEPLNAVFRAVHSIKGNAGFFGWSDVRDYAHGLENALDKLRDEQAELPDDLRLALERGFDRLEALLNTAAAGRSTAELAAPRQRELRELATLARKGPPRLPDELFSWDDASDLARDIAELPVPAAADLAQRLLWMTAEKRSRPASDASPAPADVATQDFAFDSQPSAEARSRWLRIREDRLDRMLEFVAELLVSEAELRDVTLRLSDDPSQAPLVDELRAIGRGLHRRAQTLHESLGSLRKTTLAPLFAMFPRTVRELAAQLGKLAEATVGGAQTEVDKTVVDDLDVILGHLVRNAVDHGLETPAQRVATGKVQTGTIVLRGEVLRSVLRITVEDDGRGIDPKRLRARAVEQGRITPPQALQLSDAAALDLLFEPGFSTANEVTAISGRGVGLDAVRVIAAGHGGAVTVSSTIGRGTKFLVEIPLVVPPLGGSMRS